MSDVLAGAIATVSTTLSLGYVGYVVASAAVVGGAIGLPAVSALVGIGLIFVGFKSANKGR